MFSFFGKKEHKFEDIYDNLKELYTTQLHNIVYDEVLYNQLYYIQNRDNLNNDIVNVLFISNKLIQKFVVPPRSYSKTFIRIKQRPSIKKTLQRKIKYLKSIPQAEQRTSEWYKFRHNTLTASNIWKVFHTESTQNQLIYEKCKPINEGSFSYTNIDSPLHWGQKYEPLSILYYEYTYNTKIDDFGCIPHQNYEYIAASPDGINSLIDSERFGRMLEIKNIVNRVITGIPKMEYWVQMQLQMETCDLNECDFLETRFIEYESRDEYINDPDFSNHDQLTQSNTKYRGIILHFENNNRPFYQYHPFGLNLTDIHKWEQETMNLYNDLTWVKTIYWKLQEISCVLILRNKFWFRVAQPFIETTWDIIQCEKNIDFSHRAPKQRLQKLNQSVTVDNSNIDNTKTCLINI